MFDLKIINNDRFIYIFFWKCKWKTKHSTTCDILHTEVYIIGEKLCSRYNWVGTVILNVIVCIWNFFKILLIQRFVFKFLRQNSRFDRPELKKNWRASMKSNPFLLILPQLPRQAYTSSCFGCRSNLRRMIIQRAMSNKDSELVSA